MPTVLPLTRVTVKPSRKARAYTLHVCMHVRYSTSVNMSSDVGQDAALGPAGMSNADAAVHTRTEAACLLVLHVTDGCWKRHLGSIHCSCFM